MNARKDKKGKIYTDDELYYNEDDRTRILSLPEFERERILAERIQKYYFII